MSETTKTTKPKDKAKLSRYESAEVRKMEAEAEQAELELEKARLEVEGLREQRLFEKDADKRAGVFTLETSVGNSSIVLANEIRRWGRANPKKPITLQINSPGGSVFHGLALYDTLRTLSKQGHTITTVARGYAASMGSLLFLAGDVRLIGAEAMVMFHNLSAGTGGDLYTMEDDVKFFKKLNKRLDSIVTKRTKITSEELHEQTRKRDWWIGSREAIKLGVAHEVG